jgi:hypothetical protein
LGQPRDQAPLQDLYIELALRSGHFQQAAELAQAALEANIALDRIGRIDMKRLLLWHSVLGDPDTAHSLASRCLDRFASAGTVGSAWGFLWRPEMRGFRAHQSFREFVRRLGFPDYWIEHGPPEVC